MGRTYTVYIDPFAGTDPDGNSFTSSTVTSKTINLQDAFDWSYSWRTTSGATSRVTMEISNAKSKNSIQEKQWSLWTAFGQTVPPTPSGSTTEFPPLGVRFVRFRRWASHATAVIAMDVNKFCNS